MPERATVVVAYDVNTLSKEGRRRLRRVAKRCEAWGQRVQWSVFEICVSEVELERVRQQLQAIIDTEEDSLRLYRLRGRREEVVECYGRSTWIDFEAPLIV